jgi:hypothetical protein
MNATSLIYNLAQVASKRIRADSNFIAHSSASCQSGSKRPRATTVRQSREPRICSASKQTVGFARIARSFEPSAECNIDALPIVRVGNLNDVRPAVGNAADAPQRLGSQDFLNLVARELSQHGACLSVDQLSKARTRWRTDRARASNPRRDHFGVVRRERQLTLIRVVTTVMQVVVLRMAGTPP